MDGDGRQDLFVSRLAQPPESSLLNAFIKKLYFYPFDDAAAEMHLFRQTAPDVWEDITANKFPDGTPRLYRKLEPPLWFDVNGDGALDVVVSQYPHPRGAKNALYVQRKDGRFKNEMDRYLTPLPALTYPEGSDVGDFDGDGDIDFFSYGYPFLNNGDGTYRQLCGEAFAHIPCDMEGRVEEGALVEDLNSDGRLDILISNHSATSGMPKFYLQFLMAVPDEPGRFRRLESEEEKFYGFNAHLRGKDVDGDGLVEILTINAGRLLARRNGQWVDVLPAISGKPSGTIRPLGWIDMDDDGDWDFLAIDRTSGATVLFRNTLNPKRFLRFTARGEGGRDNEFGATFSFFGADDQITRVTAYRPMSGFLGVTDPRIVLPTAGDDPTKLQVCFPSVGNVAPGHVEAAGVRLSVEKAVNSCVVYRLDVDSAVAGADVVLMPDSAIAKITAIEMPSRPKH
jgi:hypothetical protein